MRAGKKPNEPKPTGTDWQRVKSEAAADAPVAHDPAADAEPYDPNDPAAVAAYWASADIKRGPGRPPSAVTRPTLNMRADADVLAAFKAKFASMASTSEDRRAEPRNSSRREPDRDHCAGSK